MYHPTSRVLTVLELLQSRPSISGPELAERLEMYLRTVRTSISSRSASSGPVIDGLDCNNSSTVSTRLVG